MVFTRLPELPKSPDETEIVLGKVPTPIPRVSTNKTNVSVGLSRNQITTDQCPKKSVSRTNAEIKKRD